jgi:hypothetical protein
MKLETIKEMQQAMPFQPFEIETVGDKRIPVEHADMIMFSPDHKGIAVWVGPCIRVFEPSEVASVCITPKTHADKAA